MRFANFSRIHELFTFDGRANRRDAWIRSLFVAVLTAYKDINMDSPHAPCARFEARQQYVYSTFRL